MANCFLGAKAITALASTLATAMVARVDLSGNGISGASWNPRLGGSWDDSDSNLDGITALSSALPSSKIKELITSNCGLGPKSIAIVRKWRERRARAVTYGRARAVRTRVGSGSAARAAAERATGSTSAAVVAGSREDTETLALRREGQNIRAKLATQRAQLAARKQASLLLGPSIRALCCVIF